MRQEVTRALRRTLFRHAFQAPRVKEHAKAKRGGTGGALRGAADPHACEPGKTTLPTQARQARTKHCWGERRKTSRRDQEFRQAGRTSSPSVKLVVPSEKMYCSNKALCVCVCLSARVRALSGAGVSSSFRSLFKRSQTGEPFLCCYNRDEKTRGKGQKRMS